VRGKGERTTAQLEAGDELSGKDGELTAVESVTATGRVEKVYNVTVEESHTYFVGGDGWGFAVWAHNYGNEHFAEWELQNSEGKVLARGETESGFDFSLNKGEQPTFREQAEWGHTEGKVINDLKEQGLLSPDRRLIFEGERPPCGNCQQIMQEASGNHQMEIMYLDGSFNQWGWKNGVRM
jgi:hypothetical protein